MADRAYWKCPDCDYEVEGETPVDLTFADRVEEHENQHVERLIAVEIEPIMLERLRETRHRLRARATDESDVDTLAYVTERLSEGFSGEAHVVIVGKAMLKRLISMREELARESRVIYAGVIESIVRQAEGRPIDQEQGGSEEDVEG
jgi:hypothetical protein